MGPRFAIKDEKACLFFLLISKDTRIPLKRIPMLYIIGIPSIVFSSNVYEIVPHTHTDTHTWTITQHCFWVCGWARECYERRRYICNRYCVLRKTYSLQNFDIINYTLPLALCKTAVTPLLTHRSYCSLHQWYMLYGPNKYQPNTLLHLYNTNISQFGSSYPHRCACM